MTRRSVVQVLALGLMAQGFLFISPQLVQPAAASPQMEYLPPAAPDTATIIGVL
ncbi:hypothetical protein ACFVTM_01045 [Arthrobacter sp. NPDC058130]|uniref:hypothetical protein n=1 Tax=Arthrobacter sp. NPDC058130 TaxID=3346353 RepID=UPI0036E32608